jgi:hypothetical protein
MSTIHPEPRSVSVAKTADLIRLNGIDVPLID